MKPFLSSQAVQKQGVGWIRFVAVVSQTLVYTPSPGFYPLALRPVQNSPEHRAQMHSVKVRKPEGTKS